MDTVDFSRFALGKTADSVVCVDAADNQAALQAMLSQTDRHVDIISHYLEPQVYDAPACLECFETIALRSRHSRIRILLFHSKQVAQRGHGLLHLGARLSSYVQFRKPSDKYASLQATFLIADEIGTIQRPYADSLKTFVNFNDVVLARQLSNTFNQIWEESSPDPELMQRIL